MRERAVLHCVRMQELACIAEREPARAAVDQPHTHPFGPLATLWIYCLTDIAYFQ